VRSIVRAELTSLESLGPLDSAHHLRVAEVAVTIGRQMGLGKPDLRILARSGLLHDIGKHLIPDSILLKPGPLNDAELTLMKEHPRLGAEIVASAGTRGPELGAVLHHHERIDGSGYPKGLLGDAIPLAARVVAVADTYDILTSERSFRSGYSHEQASGMLVDLGGHYLDSRTVDAFLAAARLPSSTWGARVGVRVLAVAASSFPPDCRTRYIEEQAAALAEQGSSWDRLTWLLDQMAELPRTAWTLRRERPRSVS
jgi:HD-GYP domain-containing protein (c-di-GMP phosphodiesterase class II)